MKKLRVRDLPKEEIKPGLRLIGSSGNGVWGIVTKVYYSDGSGIGGLAKWYGPGFHGETHAFSESCEVAGGNEL